MGRFFYFRLLGQRSFWRFAVFQFLLLLLIASVADGLSSLSLGGQELPLAQLFAFPRAWHTLATLGCWVYLFPAFALVQIVCSEWELRLVRAHVVAGFGRWTVLGQWLLINLASVAIGVGALLAAGALLAYRQEDSPWQDSLAIMHALLDYAVFGFGYLAIALAVAVQVRRPAPALASLLAWPVIVEPVLGYSLRQWELPGLEPYLPFKALLTLVPWPGPASYGADFGSPVTIVAIAYAALACLFVGSVLAYRDL